MVLYKKIVIVFPYDQPTDQPEPRDIAFCVTNQDLNPLDLRQSCRNVILRIIIHRVYLGYY